MVQEGVRLWFIRRLRLVGLEKGMFSGSKSGLRD